MELACKMSKGTGLLSSGRLEHDSLLTKVIYKLVKKHIAGHTMASAIAKAKEFNALGIPASITFLTQTPQDKAKANYVLATYMQLIREVSRLNVKASVHMHIKQLGSTISADTAASNLEKLLKVGNKSGVFLWCEVDSVNDEYSIIKKFENARGLGFACSSIDDALHYVSRQRKAGVLKVSCSDGISATRKDTSEAGAKKEREKGKETSSDEKVAKLLDASSSLVLLSPDERLVKNLTKGKRNYKKSLVFEFQLGYNEKRLREMAKLGLNLSIYMPFGKDWVSYAMSRVPEGYLRAVSHRLLKEQGEEP